MAAASSRSPQSVCMIGGDGETSYANNSHFQTGVQSRLKPMVEEAIADLCRREGGAVPDRVAVADLGCSSGPNALALVSAAVDSLRRHHLRRLGCQQSSSRPPEVSLYLNDLPDNDFNLVFKAVPAFLEKHNNGGDGGGEGPLVLVFGVPGSFYGRLFAAQSLHLVCSSFSVHWLSKFQQDFKLFLASRAEEIVPGGWMILSLAGRPAMDFSSQDVQSEFAAAVLGDMAERGLVAAEDVDAYNVSFYAPCADELSGAAELEGSFEVVAMESRVVVTSDGDASKSVATARALRVLHESTLVQHFGRGVAGDCDVGDEFARAAEKRYRGPPAPPVMKGVVHVLSLRRK